VSARKFSLTLPFGSKNALPFYSPVGRTKGHARLGGFLMAKTGTVLKKGKKLAAAKTLVSMASLRKA
jgi:hypothetical protein